MSQPFPRAQGGLGPKAAGRDRRVVIISPHLPTGEHAGSRLLARHMEYFSPHFSLSLIGTDTEENRRFTAENHPCPIVLVGRGTRSARMLCRMRRGLCLVAGAPRKFGRNRTLRENLRAADIVELQWSESLAVAPLVRRLAPSAWVVAYFHEVMNDPRRIPPERLSPSGLVRRVLAGRERRAERVLLRSVDHSIVLSSKDERLLRGLGFSGQIDVVSPPIQISDPVPPVHPGSEVLFTGWMRRPENAEGARWLLDRVWPEVRRTVNTAQLIVAGAGPPSYLLAGSSDSVTVTGRVPDLDPYFRSARVYVAPLLSGAGVKFKVLEAMAHGVPVVATPVAADGIADLIGSACFAEITDDPLRFAAAVTRCLVDEQACAEPAWQALEKLAQHYSFDTDMADVVLHYASKAD